MSEEFIAKLRATFEYIRLAAKAFPNESASDEFAEKAITRAFAAISAAHGDLSAALRILERIASRDNKKEPDNG